MPDWNDLVNHHGPLVYRAAWRILRDRQEAEDVTQDVLLEWFRAPPPKGVSEPLLVCMATRRALDRLRRRRRVVSLEGLDPIARQGGPEAAALERELIGQLEAAVARLPPRQAEVFCLRYLNDLSYEEMAQALGISRAAVAVALHQARQRLRASLRHLVEESQP